MPIDCGGTEAMAGGVFAGLGTTSFSTNPNNLEPYDYYNNPGSRGLRRRGRAWPRRTACMPAISSSGVPASTCWRRMSSAAGNADYLELRNVDWRSAADSSYFTTEFQQASLTIQQDIGDQLKMDVLYGQSRSINDNQAFLVEFNRMDSPETFVYDERGARRDAAHQLRLRPRELQQLEPGEELLGDPPLPARDATTTTRAVT